jgi:AraC family transcriptional regulator
VTQHSSQRAEYIARINRVLDHIEAHLVEPLPLRELAKVAAFSPFHFHRIFAAVVGETVTQLVNRLRLQRAAVQLAYSPHKPITEIALDCGFSSSSSFARAFRSAHGCSASDYRQRQRSKIGQVERKEGQAEGSHGQAVEVGPGYIDGRGTITWRIAMTDIAPENAFLETEVTVQTLEPLHVAYLRHIGPYAGDAELFGRLWGQMMGWAGPRELFRPGETQCLALYHDDPETTDEGKLRLSICISVPAGTEVGGEIGQMEIAGGQYAIARFELLPDQYAQAWRTVYGAWLPQSGFQPDDRPSFERFHGGPEDHPEGKHVVDICVPVKPL